MKSQGESPEEALLDPRGMAVDPANGNVAISGNMDQESNANVEAGKEKQCRPAVQFVKVEKPTGAMSLGARYVDTAATTLFGHKGCGEEEEEEAVEQAIRVTGVRARRNALGYNEWEEYGPEQGVLWQFAPAKADEGAPGNVTASPQMLYLPEQIPTFSFANLEERKQNRRRRCRCCRKAKAKPTPRSISQARAATPKRGRRWSCTTARQAGNLWSASSAGRPGADEAKRWAKGSATCTKRLREPLQLGALNLSGGKRGFVALTFYLENEHETRVPRAEVVEFGEGGKTEGCPTVPVTTPVQEYHGEKVSKVPAGTELEVTSVLGTVEPSGAIKAQGGAKSVAWKIKYTPLEGPSQEETLETKYDYSVLQAEKGYGLKLKLKKTFSKTGTYEITDVVQTDDLAHETAQPEHADKLTVTPGGALKLTPKPVSPAEVRAHETRSNGERPGGTPGRNKIKVKKVAWNFGDADRRS